MSNDTTVFIGLDVHKDSITACCIGSDPDAPVIDIVAPSVPSNKPLTELTEAA